MCQIGTILCCVSNINISKLQYNAFVGLLMGVKQAIGQTNLIRHENTTSKPLLDKTYLALENTSFQPFSLIFFLVL